MEYILVSPKQGILGGLEVSTCGNVKIRVDFRSIFLRGIEFGASDWTADTLAEHINSYGRKKGERRWEELTLEEAEIPAGNFFRKIARPTADHPLDPPVGFLENPIDRTEILQSLEQFKSLVAEFEDVFRFVLPHRKNLDVFGPKIRSLLILSCTEFEATAKSVLRANGYKKTKTSIRDYRKLEKAMRLSEYEIIFRNFPALGATRPFGAFASNEQVKWYQAYNDTKPDRYLNYERASLKSAIEALAGNFSILIAAFGYRDICRPGENLGLGVEVSAFPKWRLGEVYRRARNPKREQSMSNFASISMPSSFVFE